MKSTMLSSLSLLIVSPLAVSAALSPSIGSTRKLREQFSSKSLRARDIDPALLYPTYNLSVPVDHFPSSPRYEPHSTDTFPLRYWFDASYYESGGPVIVLQGGETDGDERLPFLQKGILQKLAKATHGIGVVLEHRYYGESFPTADLSTESLRFLTTEQALADEAYFAQNIVFPGFENVTLTAPTTAYIGYGGSYAGGFSAFMRTEYPDVFWGSIASSGVVEAIEDYWVYYAPIMDYADQTCISNLQDMVDVIDNIFALNDDSKSQQLMDVFGLGNLTYKEDFVSVLSSPLGYWQNRNWDPAVSTLAWDHFCNNLASNTTLYSSVIPLTSNISSLIAAGNYKPTQTLTTAFLNYIGYTNATAVSSCPKDISQDDCFSSITDTEFYKQDSLSDTWRTWLYQTCTEWGYFSSGSGFPKDMKPILSRLLTPEYESIYCPLAFNITTAPNVTEINKYGGYNIQAERLAFVDGQADPWRPATVHAYPYNMTADVNRTNTCEEPFILIEGAVHHWDENGVFANQTTSMFPPAPVKEAQEEEVQFVMAWMEEWKAYQRYVKGV